MHVLLLMIVIEDGLSLAGHLLTRLDHQIIRSSDHQIIISSFHHGVSSTLVKQNTTITNNQIHSGTTDIQSPSDRITTIRTFVIFRKM
jgi:hypothetical protein